MKKGIVFLLIISIVVALIGSHVGSPDFIQNKTLKFLFWLIVTPLSITVGSCIGFLLIMLLRKIFGSGSGTQEKNDGRFANDMANKHISNTGINQG